VDATLVAVVVVALFFDFTNGFHDTANSIATSVSTRAIGPRPAVAMAAVLNFAGAFVSFEVAATIAKGIVDQEAITLDVILAGLVGAITWNLVTWFLGLPSSSSHALIGGMIGSAVMASGWDVVQWQGLKDKVLIPSLAAPFLGIVIAFVLILAITWLIARRSPSRVNHVFRRAQLVSGGFVAFTHGTNDAQKTMGVILALLIAEGRLAPDAGVPLWVKFSSLAAISLGTAFGGWRIVHTLGARITKLQPVGGMSAESAAAATLFFTAHAGIPVSTTHTITGAIVGVGTTQRLSAVRWGVAGRVVWAWILTIPGAFLISWLIQQIMRVLS